MSSTETEWIDALMRLNERIIVAQSRLSAQASRIMEALEIREDIVEEEGLFGAYRDNLRALRRTRDALLGQVKE